MSDSGGAGGRGVSPRGNRDLSKGTVSLLLNWGPAILLVTAGTAVAEAPGTPATAFGLLWSAGILWSGVSCARNALRCGRFHCTVLGIAHPLLGLAALAIALGFLGVTWNVFWDFVFWPVTVGAFIPERFGLKYLRRPPTMRLFRRRGETAGT